MDREISPFNLTIGWEKLTEQYPDSGSLKDFYKKANENERLGIIRTWITEGIPFAFKENPLLYEEIRSFIARGIHVHPKEVTLVGSARIGYSLKKRGWGKAFNSESDLDFTIISNDLFTKLVEDYQTWVKDFLSRKIIPRTSLETEYWLKAISNVDENIPKGYINTRHLFHNKKYSTIQQCNITMNNLQKKLNKTSKSPKISDVSIRVYSNWKSCVSQLKVNFNVALIWK